MAVSREGQTVRPVHVQSVTNRLKNNNTHMGDEEDDTKNNTHMGEVEKVDDTMGEEKANISMELDVKVEIAGSWSKNWEPVPCQVYQ